MGVHVPLRTQIANVKKQAVAASTAAAEQLARAEEAHAAELGRIKSEATNALTTLMQVWGLLKDTVGY